MQVLCDALLLHPVLVLKKSKMVVGSMEMGGFQHAMKKYIRKALQDSTESSRLINSRPKEPGPQLLAMAEEAFCR